MVRIRVGDAGQIFEVHRGVLCFYSDYCKAALNGQFLEASSDIFDMSTETVGDFTIFRDWIYTRKLPDISTFAWVNICRIWTFGARRQIPLLMNAAMDALIEKNRKENIIPVRQIPYIYQNTTTGSPLRQIIVDLFTRTGGRANLMSEQFSRFYIQEYLFDALNAMWKLATMSNGKEVERRVIKGEVERCVYHKHANGAKCKS